MSIKLESILERLPSLKEGIQEVREILLANAVMFGEIPAPTGDEENRVRFLLDRFNESGCQSICVDESGNGICMIPGKTGKNNILIAAHVDTPFTNDVDHTVTVHTDHIEGPGIMDNSMGIAAVASLPPLLEALGIECDDNIILMGSTKSLGHGDIAGMRFFLDNNKLPIRSAILVEGGTLGRLSYASLGMLRAVLTCKVPKDYDHMRYGSNGAIPVLNGIIQRILNIPIPKEPRTNIIFGSVSGGTAYNTEAIKAQLKFEIRSEQVGLVGEVKKQIKALADEAAFSTGTEVTLKEVAQRKNGGIDYNHSLVSVTREIMGKLEVQPRIAPSTGELAALIEKNIPALTLGLTTGSGRHDLSERVHIDGLWTGLTSIISLLQAIDGGLCDEES